MKVVLGGGQSLSPPAPPRSVNAHLLVLASVLQSHV